MAAVGLWESRGVFCRDFSKLLRETALFAVFLNSGISTALRLIAAAYTPEIGAALGIIPSPSPTPPASVQPDLKVTTSTGFKVTVVGSMQVMDTIRVEYQRNGSSGWNMAAFLTKMPGDFIITPATPGGPEAGRIRAIFIKKNVETGSFSPEYPITVS